MSAGVHACIRSRESAQQKGRRYLVEGRLLVLEVQPGFVRASCRGQGDVHQCGYVRSRWWCSCPAKTRCAHLVALQLVTAKTGRSGGLEAAHPGGRSTPPPAAPAPAGSRPTPMPPATSPSARTSTPERDRT